VNEYWQGIIGTMAFIPSITFAFVSMLGGRNNLLLLKRITAPILFCLLTIGLSLLTHRFCAWFFLSIPAYILSTFIGYSGDTLWKKIEKRFLWSLIRGLSALTFCLFTGAWLLFIIQIIVGIATTIVLGVWNPIVAAQEETLINFCSVMFVPFMVV